MKGGTHKLSAVILHTLKYKDSSLLVYAYTDMFGRQTYVVNGVRSSKNKAGMACFQPLTILDAVAYHNPKSDLQRFKEYRLTVPLQDLSFNVHKNAMALFIGEVIYKTVREQEPNVEFFHFLKQSVLELETIQAGAANFHLYFLARLSGYLGYAPGNDYAPERSFFDIPAGEFTPVKPRHELFFDAVQSQLFGRLLTSCPDDLCHIGLNREQRRAFVNNMLNFYSHHFDALAPVRSWSVLADVYD
jgi:DNA repair protein RecO (recombination protein O)